MGQLVLLVPSDRADVPIGSTAVESLARLDATSVSPVADSHTAAVILEGCTFDPARSGAAIRALGGSLEEARTLQSFAHVAVSVTASQGGTLP